jgi:signal transduction histidine kinase
MAADPDSLTFPDAPRAALDRALDEVVARAREVLATQGRLRALLRASQAVIEELDLPTVLRRIVDAAVELVGAEYGALGVIAPHGGLEQFIYVGMTPKQAGEIGHLPEGHGLLGALIDDPQAIRLEHLSRDERASGFPPHHPPMESFLGVPVRIHGEVFGNLYLTNQASGSFSEDDEQLVTSLAATAGFAINNARLFAETQRRQAWAAASAEVTAALLSGEENDPIGIVADRVLGLARAESVRVLFPTEDPAQLRIGVARGENAQDLEGTLIPVSGSVSGLVIEARQPRLINDLQTDAPDVAVASFPNPGAIIAVPLIVGGDSRGVLVVIRRAGTPPFSVADLEMVSDFAGQASVAMELALARIDRQRVMLFEDRARIARDLHDHVIQQLFAAGLEFQNIAGRLGDRPESSRIVEMVDVLDAAINQIRTAIFAMSSRSVDAGTSLRHRLLDVASDIGASLPRTPSVTFAGAVDMAIQESLADDVVAVVREGLSNIAKHANAEHTSVAVSVADGRVSIEIVDDGSGTDPSGRRSGLANMERRARDRAGEFIFDSTDEGTRLRWCAPVDTSESHRPGETRL